MSNNKNNTGLDSSIEKIKVIMVVDDLSDNKVYHLKPGYKFQYYQDGDKEAWIKIQCEVGHFESSEAANERFDSEFKESKLLKERLLFVLDSDNNKVATAMMWFGQVNDKKIDRLHWIAVSPKHQGQRITHAMLSELLKDYDSSDKIYLTSQTWSYRAISIYYRFNFIPYPFEHIKHYFKLSLEEIKNSNFETAKLKRAWDLIDKKII
ncbi:MAG TPA: GNAT family N-acetyltransferase [Erysipelotrichaceae bacterium]|nr:GNAT family N-acetyltransferase [Erysipelotrichaceae bacterium]